MTNNNIEIRLVECAYCGKTIKLNCPDTFRSPQSVKSLKKGARLFTSLAHRKVEAACNKCFKISDIYWLYGY